MAGVHKHAKSLGKGNKVQDSNSSHSALKILFFHNTLPEYRIGWFQKLAERAEIEFVFTNEQLNKKNYGFEIDYKRTKDLKCKFLTEGKNGLSELKSIMWNVEKYDFVELPPIDSFREVIYSAYIVRQCRKKGVRLGYFWEKWEAPKDKQPLERKIKNYILRVIPRTIYKKADVIFSVGKKNREYFISNKIEEEKIAWIPDASETPRCEFIDIRMQFGIPKECMIILFLGRMIPQKGVGDLIKAFATLQPKFQEKSYLLLVGDGNNLDKCKELAKLYRVKNIVFAGSVEPNLRGNYFKQCDVFVYPVTYYKGGVDVWGLTINEAIQHGKIVIATDAVGSAYELIEDGVNGYKIEPNNICALKEAIKKSFEVALKGSAEIKNSELFEQYNYENMARCYIEAVSLLFNLKQD